MGISLIGGACRGTKLKSLPGKVTRPTSARVREAVFNTLQPYLEGCVFVDICAGSGAMGLEALSRGATYAYFVENHSAALKVLKSNLECVRSRLAGQGMAGNGEVIAFDLGRINKLGALNRSVDIVWADPPYDEVLDQTAKLINWVSENVVSGGFFILEAAKTDSPALRAAIESLDGGLWDCYREREYGDTVILMWKRL